MRALLIAAAFIVSASYGSLEDAKPDVLCQLRCAAALLDEGGLSEEEALANCEAKTEKDCVALNLPGAVPTAPVDLTADYGDAGRDFYQILVKWSAGNDSEAVEQEPNTLFALFFKLADEAVFEFLVDPLVDFRGMSGNRGKWVATRKAAVPLRAPATGRLDVASLNGTNYSFKATQSVSVNINFDPEEGMACTGLEFRVYAVNRFGASSNFSHTFLPSPESVYDSRGLLTGEDVRVRGVSATYIARPFFDLNDRQIDNATVRVDFAFPPLPYIRQRDLVLTDAVTNGIIPMLDVMDRSCVSFTDGRLISGYTRHFDLSRFDEGRVSVFEPAQIMRQKCLGYMMSINRLVLKCEDRGSGHLRAIKVQEPQLVDERDFMTITCNTVLNIPPQECPKTYSRPVYGQGEGWPRMFVAGRNGEELSLLEDRTFFTDELAEPDQDRRYPVHLDFAAFGTNGDDGDLHKPLHYFVAFGRAANDAHDFILPVLEGDPLNKINNKVIYVHDPESPLDAWRICTEETFNASESNGALLPADCQAANANLSLSYERDENGTMFYRLTLPAVPPNELFGVTVAAVFNPTTRLRAWALERQADQVAFSTYAYRVFVGTEERPMSGAQYAGLIGGPLLLVSALLGLLAFYLCRRHRRSQAEMAKLKDEYAEAEVARYTEMPKKEDFYEVSRRHIQIFETEKLGSGAFGAVFKGKVLGKIRTHKDSNSHLATHMMRTENAEVAIKMLPEYADDLSKADFLKEINLMKQLGFHERLVNMLACVTESEPYLLVVEYCSNGDLLHFLRDRRKYMMKLDEMGIDYTSAETEEEFEANMVLSLKELLGYALQVSYGLEYLSQKGFIHRDVAARNVLIHDKLYAKIGDFGLCRYVMGSDAAYWGKGGRLPIKWMAPEAIRNYEFSTQSDVWSFGVLLFEIVTMGGSPYPGVQPADMDTFLDGGNRMEQPDNCPDNFYAVMADCWEQEAEKRISFSDARQRLATMLEEVTEDYSYLNLDAGRDYYNVQYSESGGDPDALESDNALNLARDAQAAAVQEAARYPEEAVQETSLGGPGDGSSQAWKSDTSSLSSRESFTSAPPLPAPRVHRRGNDSVDSGLPDPSPSGKGRHFSFSSETPKSKTPAPLPRVPLETIHSDSTLSGGTLSAALDAGQDEVTI